MVDHALPRAVDVEVPVLVVGGGPAGLTTALELARRDIAGLLIERRDFHGHYPRAHLLNVRTMETFADIGVAAEIYAESPPEDRWHKVAWYTSLTGPTPLHGRKIGEVDAWGGGRDRQRYAEASPRGFANLPQMRVDELLWQHADRAWPGRVRARQELVALVTDGDGVTATVRDTVAGLRYAVRARYVVAADGGRTCAPLLGIDVAGPRALLDMVNVHFSADLSAIADPQALLTYFISPQGRGSFAGALLGLGPGRWGNESPQWSLGIAYRIGDPAGEQDDAVVEHSRRILGDPELEMTVHAVSHWQFEGVVAERFRHGPVFLVGDAAHRHPPTGGLGLNTAIGDVSNLAWKLAAVLKDEAADTLLDTYEPERRPVAARNVEHSLRNAGRHAPVAAALGLAHDMSDAEGWAQIAVWASDTDEGRRRRRAAARAIAGNAEDYSQLNIEAGFAYEHGAVVTDGTPPPPDHESATRFVPTARPGHHVPHVWLHRAGKRVSTSDLVAAEGFTLIVRTEAAEVWREAARDASTATSVPVTVVVIGDEFVDAAGQWAACSGTHPSGAVLVRPDRHVAWRSAEAPSDARVVLGDVIDRLTRRPINTRDYSRSALDRITEAGEALRAGATRPPRLFDTAV